MNVYTNKGGLSTDVITVLDKWQDTFSQFYNNANEDISFDNTCADLNLEQDMSGSEYIENMTLMKIYSTMTCIKFQ